MPHYPCAMFVFWQRSWLSQHDPLSAWCASFSEARCTHCTVGISCLPPPMIPSKFTNLESAIEFKCAVAFWIAVDALYLGYLHIRQAHMKISSSATSSSLNYSSTTAANFSFILCNNSSYFLVIFSSPSVGTSNFMFRSSLCTSAVLSRTLDQL